MAKSNLEYLDQRNMKVLIENYPLVGKFFWPELFPTQYNQDLKIAYLRNNMGIPVAADVVSFDSKAPIKTRKVVDKIDGEIPKIEIDMPLKESELNRYQSLLAMVKYGNNPSVEKQLIDMVYDDQETVWNAINARLEWLTGQILSKGKVALTSANNGAGVVTETAVDFLVPSTQKQGYTTAAWTVANAATAKPITELKSVMTAARKLGVKLNYMLTNQDTFDVLVQIAEVQKLTAPYMAAATEAYLVPTLAQLNAAFVAKGLPQVVVIESYVTIETAAGAQTSTGIWTDGVFTLVPELQCGNTLWTMLAEEGSNNDPDTIRVRRDHVLIKRFAENNPYVEHTVGAAIALPVWGSAQRSWMIDSTHSSWSY